MKISSISEYICFKIHLIFCMLSIFIETIQSKGFQYLKSLEAVLDWMVEILQLRHVLNITHAYAFLKHHIFCPMITPKQKRCYECSCKPFMFWNLYLIHALHLWLSFNILLDNKSNSKVWTSLQVFVCIWDILLLLVDFVLNFETDFCLRRGLMLYGGKTHFALPRLFGIRNYKFISN